MNSHSVHYGLCEPVYFCYRHVDKYIMVVQPQNCSLEISQPPNDDTWDPEIHISVHQANKVTKNGRLTNEHGFF